MLHTLFMSLFLSYLSFDVPTQETVWLLREDHSGLYAIATEVADDDRQITVSIDDDDVDYEEEILIADAFERVPVDFDVIEVDEEGRLLLHSALFGTDESPDFVLEGPSGFYYLKKK